MDEISFQQIDLSLLILGKFPRVQNVFCIWQMFTYYSLNTSMKQIISSHKVFLHKGDG